MLTSMREYFKGKGQGIVEYALLLAFVVAVAMFALKSDEGLGQGIKDSFSKTASELTNFSPSPAGNGGNG